MTIAGSLGLVLLLVSLAVIPGPSDLLVAGCAVKRGYRSVVHMTLGILVADLIFILAVVYGATAWLEYFSRYHEWLVWLSSGVLIAFGIWMLRIRIRPTDLSSTAETGRDFSFGAGNNMIRLIRDYPEPFACDLCDLSRPMLERAKERISKEKQAGIRIFEGDFKTISFDESGYDVIIAAAVLHHLRDDHDWEEAFAKIYRLLRPGGSFWITDLVAQESAQIHEMMWQRYGAYLETLGGAAYRDEVLAYIV